MELTPGQPTSAEQIDRASTTDDYPSIPGYEILERIGAGGMGEVYRARQSSLNRPVAIKILGPVEGPNSTEQAARFDREALLMAESAHPNIVTIHDRGMMGDHPFLVMEYVKGKSLRQLLIPDQPMPTERARAILKAVASALSHLHERGILHRDLKPENVLSDERGNVKVCDFGIAVALKEMGLVTQSGQFLGTIDYLSPEQRHRLPVDERADQFSLAVMAYEMLTGAKPLGIFEPPSQLNPALGPGVDKVLLRGLQNHREDRYRSVEDFATALDRTLRDDSSERRRRLAVLACAGLAAVLVGLVLWARIEPNVAIVSPVNERLIVTSESPGNQPDAIAATAERVDLPPNKVALLGPEEAIQIQKQWANQLKVPVIEENTIGMKLVLIPPGEFKMGTSAEEVARLMEFYEVKKNQRKRKDPDLDDLRSEVPRRRVKITQPFYLGATEVTLGQFRRFVEATGYKTEAERMGGAAGRENNRMWSIKSEYSWQHFGDMEPSEDWPVINVSQSDAVAFCNWLSKQETNSYRLPSEAEWEYACRAGSRTRWCFGESEELMDSFAWYKANSGFMMHPVGLKKPNDFGLFDMHGNVWEWCSDEERFENPEPFSSVGPAGPSFELERVMRGGAFMMATWKIRSASRCVTNSHLGNQHVVGFRVVRTLSQPSPFPKPEFEGALQSASPTGERDGVASKQNGNLAATTSERSDLPATAVAPFDPEEARRHQKRWASHLKVPMVEENTIGMKLILIPPGEFLMGSTEEEVSRLVEEQEGKEKADFWIPRYRSEAPQRRVRITKPFLLGRTEVTVSQFRAFVEATGYVTDDEMDGDTWGVENEEWVKKPSYSWRELGEFVPTDEHPVVNLGWNDVVAFCEWLSEKEGAQYKLPTEAQWEYACRAGSTTRWSFGDDPDLLGEYAWFQANAGESPQSVGRKKPNGFGLFDMHGNVREWVANWNDPVYYIHSPVVDTAGSSLGQNRLCRGGAFDSPRSSTRSAYRYWRRPSVRDYQKGFRVTRTLASDRESQP